MTTTHRASPAETLRTTWSKVRAALLVGPPPTYVAPEDDPRVAWVRRLDRIRAALEQARTDLTDGGWTQGAWFSVPAEGSVTAHAGSGTTRLASPSEAFDLVRPGATPSGACLVGALLRRAEDPDRATTHDDVWGCVDELYEALHESMGHGSFPPGRVDAHERRRGKLAVLTAWNDQPAVRREDVLTLLDRAVGRTMVGACAV